MYSTQSSGSRRGFTLVELLATIAIMAVLIVAALPYVADYTSWARATTQERDAQVVAGAIARWIAVGGQTTKSGTLASSSYHTWTGAASDVAWSASCKSKYIIDDLIYGWTVVPGGNRDPFIAPNTAWTALGKNIKIKFSSPKDYTVTGRSH